jgi:acetyl-CoA carboxylase carboxyl transferase subunit alpha
MPELKNRQFLDFEKPSKDLYDQVELLKAAQEKSKTDMSGSLLTRTRILEAKKNSPATFSLAKSTAQPPPDRPYTMKYIDKMCTNFIELHGDRNLRTTKPWWEASRAWMAKR